jgi:hypothetical protein
MRLVRQILWSCFVFQMTIFKFYSGFWSVLLRHGHGQAGHSFVTFEEFDSCILGESIKSDFHYLRLMGVERSTRSLSHQFFFLNIAMFAILCFLQCLVTVLLLRRYQLKSPFSGSAFLLRYKLYFCRFSHMNMRVMCNLTQYLWAGCQVLELFYKPLFGHGTWRQ